MPYFNCNFIKQRLGQVTEINLKALDRDSPQTDKRGMCSVQTSAAEPTFAYDRPQVSLPVFLETNIVEQKQLNLYLSHTHCSSYETTTDRQELDY